ncbi:MAG: bis(5'-nucleosyl)-tetraphosphatase (symmetrical) YqeK [Candidatus Izemoplasmatales bacterium]|nr:bis(5'-nucleosyl)-tetraphosphatase (symmetrical) YqeK [Candidatus Izemoplasmatales bacterium]
MTSIEARDLATKLLWAHPLRLQHVEAVAKLAKELAIHYGINPEKAMVAAYLHDATKYLSPEETSRYLQKEVVPDHLIPEFVHAYSAAGLAQDQGVKDPEILNAIRYHTSGRPQMAMLEKIVFLADYAEETRGFDNLKVRQVAFENLDEAIILTLQEILSFLASRGKPIDRSSQATLESYLSLRNGGNS